MRISVLEYFQGFVCSTRVMCGLHAVCGSCDSAVYSFLEPGPTRAPATAGLTASAMKPLSDRVAAEPASVVFCTEGIGGRAEFKTELQKLFPFPRSRCKTSAA